MIIKQKNWGQLLMMQSISELFQPSYFQYLRGNHILCNFLDKLSQFLDTFRKKQDQSVIRLILRFLQLILASIGLFQISSLLLRLKYMKNSTIITAAKSAEILRSVKKQLRMLQPTGASQRQIHATSRNHESATQEIRSMQRRFNQEREELFMKIHNTTTMPNLSKPRSLMKRIHYESRKLTPMKSRTRKNSLGPWEESVREQSTPGQFSKQTGFPLIDRKVDEPIESIINQCEQLNKSEIQRPDGSPFHSALHLIREQNKKRERHAEIQYDLSRDYVNNRAYLRRSDNRHLTSRKNLKKFNLEKLETSCYVSCKFRRKTLWKYAGYALPKRTEQEIGNYMNTNFL